MSYIRGTRIRFPREIIQSATGDHPEFLMASAGEEGEVVAYNETGVFPYSVKTDSWPNSFGAEAQDFEILETAAVVGESDEM